MYVSKINGYTIKDKEARDAISTEIVTRQNAILKEENARKADIQTLKSELTTKKYIIISDSYGVESVAGISNWVNSFMNYLSLDESDVYTSRNGSRGFVPEHLVPEGFLESLMELNSTITDKTAITDIIVCGGVNDTTMASATIEQNIASFMEYVKANYVNARVYIGCIGRHKGNYASNLKIVKNVLESYKSCVKYGAIYLHGVEYALRGNDCFIDSVHPSEKGNGLISKAIVHAYLNGNANVHRIETVTLNPSGTCNKINYMYTDIQQTLVNGHYAFALSSNGADLSYQISFRFTNPYTLTSTSLAELGTFSNNSMFDCASGMNVYEHVSVEIIKSSGAFQTMTGWLCLGANKLYFRPNLDVNSGSWGVEITDVIALQVKFAPFNFEALTN